MAALGLLQALPATSRGALDTGSFDDDVFSLGVASGYPGPDRCVLWTRLAREPLRNGGGMPAITVPVHWEISADETFRRVVRSGTALAEPEWAHAVHVEPMGLEPGRPYWYRFTAGGARSPTGRTATAPERGKPLSRLRLAVASCQQYEHGYYVAYEHIADSDLDLVLHLGDYIYEHSWGTKRIRYHETPECKTLDDYRNRYALYRSDRNLQAAHAACPWLVVWDDHEVENDYANDVSQDKADRAVFLARRAAAYKAYYEHMPLPAACRPSGPYLRLYQHQTFGDLANIFMLDQRQYRSPQACPKKGRSGGNRVSDCPELDDPGRTMLGERQEQWLEAGLSRSATRWNLLGQGTVMTYIDELPGPGERFWTDNWNGYPAARRRLLQTLKTTRVANPVVLSGDIHAFLAADLNQIPEQQDSAIVASEFATTSISSQATPQKSLDRRGRDNPNLLLLDGRYRGYLRLDIDRRRMRADMIAMDTVSRTRSGSHVLASFVVENGVPGPRVA